MSYRYSKFIQPLSIWGIFFLVFLIDFLFSNELFARPGGGSSYSGGGSSSSSGDGGGGIFAVPAALVGFGFNEIRGKNKNNTFGAGRKRVGLAILTIIVGFVGFGVILLNNWLMIPYFIIGGGLLFLLKRGEGKEKQAITSRPTANNLSQRAQKVDNKLTKITSNDPNFSQVLFFDFVSSLYIKYYQWVGNKRLKDIKPFLSEEILTTKTSKSLKNKRVTEVVIGSMSIYDIYTQNNQQSILVDIESNYTITDDRHSSRYIVGERWLFVRNQGVISLAPGKTNELSCPHCDSPTNFNDAGNCEYCGTFIEAGARQWMLKSQTTIHQDSIRAQTLGSYAEEQGTDLPTVYHWNLSQMVTQLMKNHQQSGGSPMSWNHYKNLFTNQIVRPTFMEIYKAWTSLKWNQVRHLVSDRLYESYQFWIDAYKKENLRNKLDEIDVSKIQVARVDVDKFYESITVRIFASCYDYVENTSGKLIGGSKKHLRLFSEYWTFIRRTGVTKNDTEVSLDNCPNCGAPADRMGQAAECGYCGTKISTGEFSWILAYITQDEVYKG